MDSAVKLTNRERTVLYYCLLGQNSRQIAGSLGLSIRTVQNNLERIKSKYDCESLVALLARFIDHSYVHFLLNDTGAA